VSKKASGAPPPFVLWREVLTAYAMPAVMAGLGGAVTRQPQLVLAALTTIGGTSAAVAAALGAALRRRPARTRPARTPRVLAAAGLGLAAAALALAMGLAAAHWLPQFPPLGDSPWPHRLPVDLPVSSAIAATIITWRWRGSRPARESQHRLHSAARPERQTS
jgi:membrane associated rhomboid family serine protease